MCDAIITLNTIFVKIHNNIINWYSKILIAGGLL